MPGAADRKFVPYGADYDSRPAGTNNEKPWIRLIELGDESYAMATLGYGFEVENINSASTTTVKTGEGILAAVNFNKLVASSSVTIYDNTEASGKTIGTITQPLGLLASQIVMPFNVRFTNGLTVVTSAADDISVIYL